MAEHDAAIHELAFVIRAAVTDAGEHGAQRARVGHAARIERRVPGNAAHQAALIGTRAKPRQLLPLCCSI